MASWGGRDTGKDAGCRPHGAWGCGHGPGHVGAPQVHNCCKHKAHSVNEEVIFISKKPQGENLRIETWKAETGRRHS